MTATTIDDVTVLDCPNDRAAPHVPHALAIRIEGKAQSERARELYRMLLDMAEHLAAEDAGDRAAGQDMAGTDNGYSFVYHVVLQPTSR